jgi:putative hydrolase of the HAD superfamily
MIQAILFDFGNVIAFFDHMRAIRRVADRCTMAPDLILPTVYDAPLEHDFESGRIGGDEFLQRMKEIVGFRGDIAELRAAFIDIFWPNPPVQMMIPQLAKRYRLVLASNTNELHAAQFRRQFADVMQHFHALGLSFQAGVRKPTAEFYQYCLGLAECSAEEAVFIDDVAKNVAGAAALGIRAIRYEQKLDLAVALRSLGVDV